MLIRVTGAFIEEPIADAFAVDPEGKVDLGPSYGRVRVVGLTVDEAQDAIRKHLASGSSIRKCRCRSASRPGAQQIDRRAPGRAGRPRQPGHVRLGVRGRHDARASHARRSKRKLSEKLDNPEVVVDVFAYNSKKYYVITQGGGHGDNVAELPITGNETVLDAIARIGGISHVSSTRIWIARPAPERRRLRADPAGELGRNQPRRSTATNYQLMPRDRLYIAEDPLYPIRHGHCQIHAAV